MQVTVVTQQPGLPQVMEVRSKPNNFLILSIVNMLCCFFILGLIALIFSVQVGMLCMYVGGCKLMLLLRAWPVWYATSPMYVDDHYIEVTCIY